MNRGSQASITYFEDLSNEVMYEIFEFLDLCHISDSFSNLNIRFNGLLNYFILSNKINISSMSKSMFQRFYTHIIIPYQDQITSLRLSNRFVFYLPFSLFDIITKMTRLATLIFENIESKYLENLLNDLSSLPCLSSLVIIPIDDVQNKNSLYRKIFRLPTLKYCKVTFNEHYSSERLQMAKKNELSPIRNFIINSRCCINELHALLSYVPQLRRLSCYNLSQLPNTQIQAQPIVLNNLTHLSLKTKNNPLRILELLINKRSCQLQVIHIATNYHSAYLDTNIWEQLILNYMPNLRIFHIELLHNYELDQFLYRFSIDQFISLSWFERQWFVNREYKRFPTHFYSIQSNRYYNLSYQDIISSARNKTSFYSVDHIYIQDKLDIDNNSIYFPNVTKLTLFDYSNSSRDSISTILDRMISLTQLTTLNINYRNFCIGKLVELLYYSPNIVTLMLNSISFFKISYTSIQESQTFEIVSKKNIITNMTIEDNCTVENVTLLNSLCPRLQHLTIGIPTYDHDYYQSIVKVLLSNDNDNTRHLSTLCFTNANEFSWEAIRSLDLHSDVLVKLIAMKLYLWW